MNHRAQPFTRPAAIAELQANDEPFDVIVVGGGATGLGTAIDAASRGYRTLLVERDDFAKGTSGRSTKLVHGGVRYLKQGNISLVLDALRERGRLLSNAPHLTRNVSFVIPTYSWWETGFYGVGLKLYDRLAGRLSLGRSRILDRETTLNELPNLNPRRLTAGILYHDGQFDDTRLAINLAQTAADQGAIVVNHMECVGLLKSDGKVRGIRTRDTLSGVETEIHGKAVVNAAGVFVDGLRRLDQPGTTDIVTISQGVHLVLPKRFLPGDTALMIPKTSDGRVLFAVPWQDRVILGTTDTPLQSSSREPRALQEERDFLLAHAAKYLTEAPTPLDVLSIYAGLRALVRTRGSGNTASLSRDHTIVVSDSGLVTVTGGKWTTYRKMGEDVINRLENIKAWNPRPCRTTNLAIHGSTTKPHPCPNLCSYGSDAANIEDIITAQPELEQLLHPALPYQQAEVVWHARHEMAMTVEDVLARRTRALTLDAAASLKAAAIVATLLAAELGHDAKWQQEQVTAYRDLASGYLFPNTT